MKYLICLFTFSISAGQSVSFKKELQEKLDYSISQSEQEKNLIINLQKIVIEDVVKYLYDEFGLIISDLDINISRQIYNDLTGKQLFTKFLLTKNTVIKEKLFLGGTLFFESTLFIKYLKKQFKNEIDQLVYSDQQLKFELSEIIKYRNDVYSQKKNNSDSLLSVLKIGMLRQEVFNILLFFNERNVEIDYKNVIISTDKKKRFYWVKNTYIRLIFDDITKQLIEIENLTPNYN